MNIFLLIMKRSIQLAAILFLTAFILMQCHVIWKSPKAYTPVSEPTLMAAPMTLEEYTTSGVINTHARPYIFKVESKDGKVLVCGVEHSNDPNDHQFQRMRDEWEKINPTVALVEGRLGFLFKWTQDPIEKLGEGGLTASLAKSNGVDLYSWDPDKQAQVKYAVKKTNPKLAAAYFCLRPYLNKYSGVPKEEQDKIMKGLIKDRTDEDGIRGAITSLEQLDSIWKSVCPNEVNWRNYKNPRNGWPAGTFEDIAESMNIFRNEYLCTTILELMNKGERVFVTMGSSHAVCIERTLQASAK